VRSPTAADDRELFDRRPAAQSNKAQYCPWLAQRLWAETCAGERRQFAGRRGLRPALPRRRIRTSEKGSLQIKQASVEAPGIMGVFEGGWDRQVSQTPPQRFQQYSTVSSIIIDFTELAF
jgi:hypothetical protein